MTNYRKILWEAGGDELIRKLIDHVSISRLSAKLGVARSTARDRSVKIGARKPGAKLVRKNAERNLKIIKLSKSGLKSREIVKAMNTEGITLGVVIGVLDRAKNRGE